MNTISKLAIFIIALGTIAACKKDESNDPTPPTPTANYTQLKVGNYWIYERIKTDLFGNVTFLGTIDSCYVMADSTINGNTYHKYIAPGYPTLADSIYFLRDSSSCLVSASGEILFSFNNFSTTFEDYYSFVNVTDTLCHITTYMTDKDSVITVPAGNFTTSNFQKQYIMYPPYNTAGTYRYINNRFADGVGLIKQTLPFFASSPDITEKVLIRHHVN